MAEGNDFRCQTCKRTFLFFALNATAAARARVDREEGRNIYKADIYHYGVVEYGTGFVVRTVTAYYYYQSFADKDGDEANIRHSILQSGESTVTQRTRNWNATRARKLSSRTDETRNEIGGGRREQ